MAYSNLAPGIHLRVFKFPITFASDKPGVTSGERKLSSIYSNHRQLGALGSEVQNQHGKTFSSEPPPWFGCHVNQFVP